MRFSLKKAIFAVLFISAASANATVVNFTVNNYDSNPGSFSGIDSDSNGLLSRSELTLFQFDSNTYGHHVTLATLFGFGDFNLDTNQWIPNGAGWGGLTSYFSWNGGDNAVTSSWADVSTTIISNDVPEPASLALLGLSLAGLAAAKRRKA